MYTHMRSSCVTFCFILFIYLFLSATFAIWGYQASEDRVGPGWLCDGRGIIFVVFYLKDPTQDNIVGIIPL